MLYTCITMYNHVYIHAYMYTSQHVCMTVPIEETKTTPSARARGPPHLRYLSLGAQAAVRPSPSTTPAVYRAARPTRGPGGGGVKSILCIDVFIMTHTCSSRAAIRISKINSTSVQRTHTVHVHCQQSCLWLKVGRAPN